MVLFVFPILGAILSDEISLSGTKCETIVDFSELANDIV